MTGASARLPISIEFFPPKTPEGVEKLRIARRELYALRPGFCSVTYGAGGSTQQGTLDAVREILADGIDGAPHFSCIGASQASLRGQLDSFKAMGVRTVVALRGDLPSGYGLAQPGSSEFRYASDLVAFVRKETGAHFHINVGAYPETHPQARSPRADVEAFVAKVKAGADTAITQFFYNADAYFRFVDEAARRGAQIPVVPGIMPITNSAQLLRFADANGSEVPRWIRLRLQSFGDDAASIKAFGLDVVSALCERLRSGGAPGLHFYSMNQPEATFSICERIGLVKGPPGPDASPT